MSAATTLHELLLRCENPEHGNGNCPNCQQVRDYLAMNLPGSITRQVNQLLIGEMAERGMSRSDMSRALGVSRETITIALNDTSRDWKICTLDEWADALNCDLVIKLQKRRDEPEIR